jgi:hypothetical protein
MKGAIMSQSIQDYFKSIIEHTDALDTSRPMVESRALEYSGALIKIRQAARAAIQQINKPKPQPPRQQALL